MFIYIIMFAKKIYNLFVVTSDVLFILLGHAERVSLVIINIKMIFLLSALWHRGFRTLLPLCFLLWIKKCVISVLDDIFKPRVYQFLLKLADCVGLIRLYVGL